MDDCTKQGLWQTFLPGEQDGDVVVQRVIVSFGVQLLLPFAEAEQTVVSVMRNLQVILPSTCNQSTHTETKQNINQPPTGPKKIITSLTGKMVQFKSWHQSSSSGWWSQTEHFSLALTIHSTLLLFDGFMIYNKQAAYMHVSGQRCVSIWCMCVRAFLLLLLRLFLPHPAPVRWVERPQRWSRFQYWHLQTDLPPEK